LYRDAAPNVHRAGPAAHPAAAKPQLAPFLLRRACSAWLCANHRDPAGLAHNARRARPPGTPGEYGPLASAAWAPASASDTAGETIREPVSAQQAF